MKKYVVMAMMLFSSMGSWAFDFDGISLNDSYYRVAQEISKRGYSYDQERDCLKGNCQGTEIYLSINYKDVTKKGKVGQLIVEVPIENHTNAYSHAIALFNVVYHQAPSKDGSISYLIDKDGTILHVSQKGSSLLLIYNTPFYSKTK